VTTQSAAPLHATLSQDELEGWGERIAREAALPLVLALRGELGAGKSTLARAIARGAGVGGSIPSPTFNLLITYRGARGAVQHFDLYRLTDPDEVWELGWEEIGREREIVLIEWPERAEALLPIDRWDVRLTAHAEPELREITAHPVGAPPSLPPPVVER
jgi:tRNA threonylcarbamoyladenosine biosynthesis protein TsaE